MLLVLLVIFIVLMLVWGLGLGGVIPLPDKGTGWLAFISVLILGLVVFLLGTGVVVIDARTGTTSRW